MAYANTCTTDAQLTLSRSGAVVLFTGDTASISDHHITISQRGAEHTRQPLSPGTLIHERAMRQCPVLGLYVAKLLNRKQVMVSV